MSELKPCPFCGSADLKMPEWHTFVLCNDCGAETRGNDGGLEGVEAAIAEWNRRAALPSDSAQAPVAWSVYNGVRLDQIFMLRESADKYAANMQKSHDLSGSLAAFVVKPLYAAPVAPAAVQPDERTAFVDAYLTTLDPGAVSLDPQAARCIAESAYDGKTHGYQLWQAGIVYARVTAPQDPVKIDDHAPTIDHIREALPEFHQQDDYLLAHGASLMSESSHEIIHVDTLKRIVDAACADKHAASEHETYVRVPETPSAALLRPFYDCPHDELELAWSAMVWIARRQARATELQSDEAIKLAVGYLELHGHCDEAKKVVAEWRATRATHPTK